MNFEKWMQTQLMKTRLFQRGFPHETEAAAQIKRLAYENEQLKQQLKEAHELTGWHRSTIATMDEREREMEEELRATKERYNENADKSGEIMMALHTRAERAEQERDMYLEMLRRKWGESLGKGGAA